LKGISRKGGEMKNVTLKITGKHVYENVEEDQMELVTEGKLDKKGDTLYLTYEESEFSGTPGCRTELMLTQDVISMTRSGLNVGLDTEIRFKKGERHKGFYDTPFGPVEMEVLTNSIENNVTYDKKGRVDIDYCISLKGLSEGRSKLNIEVM